MFNFLTGKKIYSDGIHEREQAMVVQTLFCNAAINIVLIVVLVWKNKDAWVLNVS